MKMRITFCVSVVLLMVLMPFLPVRGEGEIYDNTLRLHILANSDTVEDQTLKLKVRDALIAKTAELTKDCSNMAMAEEELNQNMDLLTGIARQTVRAEGYDYTVDLTLEKEYYTERQYGSFRLPSGRYNSLIVNIGQARGQNWWCVLFPPLCVEAAEAEEELAATGFTPNQIKLLTDSETPKYVIRFRILEWIEDIAELFRG